MSNFFIISPTAITAAMLGGGTTIAEPASGETEWIANGTYAIEDLKIRTTTHRVYRCAIAHTGRSVLPENDPSYWQDVAPTQRYAPFDYYTNTAATGTTSFTYVLSPGFFNAVSFYGLTGQTLAFTVKDAPAGTTLFTETRDLYAQARGLYEYLFTPLRQIQKLVFTGLPISPTAELTVTVNGGTGNPVALGMFNIGNYQGFISAGGVGGVENGASASPRTFSYVKVNDDGSLKIVKNGAATDLSGSVVLPAEDAAAAVQLVQSVLDVPVSVIASDVQRYDYLNTFGLLSGSMVPKDYVFANFSYSVKGLI